MGVRKPVCKEMALNPSLSLTEEKSRPSATLLSSEGIMARPWTLHLMKEVLGKWREGDHFFSLWTLLSLSLSSLMTLQVWPGYGSSRQTMHFP